MIRLKQNSLCDNALRVDWLEPQRTLTRSTLLLPRPGQGGIEKETVRYE